MLIEKTNNQGFVSIQVPTSSKKFPANVIIEAPGYKSYQQEIQAAADLPAIAVIDNNSIENNQIQILNRLFVVIL